MQLKGDYVFKILT